MSNLPLGDDLKRLFEEVTNGEGQDPPVRAILVQNDNGVLKLVDTAEAQGSDKEDFSPVLSKLFAKEPTKPGYALFRLDSKSPAGLYEWINCAFRPDGARIREKMQYTITQASLFKGLSEQHFLETVYGSTVAEFAFPSKLRNARKHDYQNPQQSTRGKSAAQAAGTDAGGAKRNFEALSAATKAQTASSTAPKEALLTTHTDDKTFGSADQLESPKASKAAAEEARNHIPSEQAPIEVAESSQAAEEELPITEQSEPGEKSQDQDSAPEPEAVEDVARETSPFVSKERTDKSPISTSYKPVVVTSEAGHATRNENDAAADEQDASTSVEKTESNGEAVAEELSSASPKPSSSTMVAAPAAASVSATSTTQNSTGVGRGVEGLHTEKERQLEALKADESRQRSSNLGTGGPRTGFQWHDDVAPALQSLADKSANLVILRVDLSKEEVQLAARPSRNEPEQLANVLTESQAERENEPSYVVYAHPQASAEEGKTGVGVIYVCPLSCTVRQRMLYSTNMIKLCKGIDSIDGLALIKRAETSDPEDLTVEELSQIMLASSDQEDRNATTQANFSRPKRPGRK